MVWRTNGVVFVGGLCLLVCSEFGPFCVDAQGKWETASSIHGSSPKLAVGREHEPENCPQGTVVSGFRLRLEKDRGSDGDAGNVAASIFSFGITNIANSANNKFDDTALNAIQLACTNATTQQFVQGVTSGAGEFGDWSETYYCPDRLPAIGYKFKVEPQQPAGHDDAGGTNFKLLCPKGGIADPIVPYDPKTAVWSEEVKCPAGQVVCGLRTTIHDVNVGTDGFGLTDVELNCCTSSSSTPLQSPNCTYTEEWVDVITLINNGDDPQEQKFEITVGVEETKEKSKTQSSSTSTNHEFGAEVGVEIGGFKAGFSTTFGKSSTTGFDWTTTDSSMWSKSTTTTITQVVKGHHRGVVRQLIGTCGDFHVRTKARESSVTPIPLIVAKNDTNNKNKLGGQADYYKVTSGTLFVVKPTPCLYLVFVMGSTFFSTFFK